MSRLFLSAVLSLAVSLPLAAQVISQDAIQGQLVEMLQSGQAPAPISPSPEPTGESSDAPAPSEALEAPPVDAEAPATLSASQTYFQTLLGEVLQPFGLAEFKNPGSNELLLFNALSDEYKLSAGDVLQIVIRGLYSESMNVKIDRNGAVTLPQFLPISLAGLTVDEAADHLAEVVEVNDASARVSVTVSSARLVPLQVGGMVSAPQVLAIPAYTPLSIALARSGGLQPDASLRRIRILSQEQPPREIDLYGLLLGDPDFREPLLAEGDRVFVPPSSGSIALAGVVPLAATQAYVDFLLSIARRGDLGETIAAMTPCMRLYAFLGRALSAGRVAPLYADWVKTYADPGFEALAAQLETLLDRHAEDSDAVRANYARAMDLEYGFFNANL